MLKYLILILIVLILPLQAFAQEGFLRGPIVPCDTERNPGPCTLCHIFEMIQNIINFILELIIVIAPIFIAVGGLIIIFNIKAGSKPDKVSLGKKIITNVIIGVAIALLAWTLINTVINALVGGTQTPGRIPVVPWPWNEIDCNVSETTSGFGH